MDLEIPVTLVVKAPSQKVEDHTVQCALGWTVRKLKAHLSQVYPSKPKENQQKLIYSGQLLQDHLQLKDVLRKDLEVDEHTVHLVCAASYGEPSQPHPQKESQSSASSGSSSNSSRGSSPPHTPPASPNPRLSTDGVRHRGSAADAAQGAAMFQQQYGANPMAMYYGMMGGMQYSPEQMMWLQQMYAQQMAAYMQMYQQGVPDVGVATPQVVNQEEQAAPNQAANQRANRPANQVMNAGAGGAMFEDDEEEEGMNRDWLDWMYTFSRFGILLAIVYFYSSFGRFVFVLTFFLFMYMYQAGWFRLARRQQPQPERPQQNQPEQAPPQLQQNEPERVEQVEENQEPAQEETNEANQVETDQEQRPGALTVAWSFLSTFFSSLIPNQPPPVNAN